MTPLEIKELITTNVKALSEKYDNHLVQLGRMISLNDELCDRAVLLKRSIKQLKTSNKSLTSRNKKLTTQLAKAKESLEYYKKTTVFQNNVINRAREISPQVCTLINDILNEEYALSNANK